MREKCSVLMVVILWLCSCSKDSPDTLFTIKPSSHTGISFINSLNPTPQLNILNYLYFYNGAGVAAADFNNDGWVDLYFTSNQGADKLYINKGSFTFQDVTQQAKINNHQGWTTGVTHVDINNDGLLDIYVCKVGDHLNLTGHNLLFVNQGVNDDNGIPQFKEEAAKYGLDFIGYSTQAAFFDYDLDGDLDMYLLNHSVNPNRSYGKGAKRQMVDNLSGDILFRNDNGTFKDISKEAGIFQGSIGYGLGLAISDVNNDGYPDIYVGNDFFENDYLYINQKDGTFKDQVSENNAALGHTSHFSMGNDLADINNDGLVDIFSLDMLPEDLETYKTSGLEYPYPIYQQYLKNGFAPQYMQNTLHVNMGDSKFLEIANLSGIEATEWSWGGLFADFDNDGHKDLYVSNGIRGVTNDMDFISYISNEEIQKNIESGLSDEDMQLIDRLPQKKVPNYFYKNNGNLTFTDVTQRWGVGVPSYSHGSAYADLDNDGDLDLVVNNVNEEAFVLQNTLTHSNWIKVKFKGPEQNKFGIGSKVLLFLKSSVQIQENTITRGYLSAKDADLNFGVGKESVIDSIQIVWPGGSYQTLRQVSANQTLMVSYKEGSRNFYSEKPSTESLFTRQKSKLDFIHNEQPTLDFDRNPLLPFASSNEGPSVSVSDVNRDGRDDFFISGAKGQSSMMYFQDENGNFNPVQSALFEEDAISEDIDHVLFDMDNDNDLDLLVVSAGNEFVHGRPLRPRLYINQSGTFVKDEEQFQQIEVNASQVTSIDFDADGDLDVCITSNEVPTKFGEIPTQHLFENDGNGNFQEITQAFAPDFYTLGNVKAVAWTDLDQNGFPDLVAAGHWTPITIFLNNGQKLIQQENNGLGKTHGWWNSITLGDLDGDGDLDILAGNWGLNTKFSASPEKPITLYSNDFDDNGSVETVVTYFHGDRETPFASKDELAKQMPFLNKKFLYYKDFAKASLEELFGTEKLKNAKQRKVFHLATSYFQNDGKGNFSLKKLPLLVQSSTVNDIYLEMNDQQRINEILMVGNNFEISTQLGRLDASHGLSLQNDGRGNLTWKRSLGVSGAARKIEKIMINGKEEYIITRNNDTPIFLTKKKLAE